MPNLADAELRAKARTGDTSEHNVTCPASNYEAHGYLALPGSGAGPGLIVIQEWRGLTTRVPTR